MSPPRPWKNRKGTSSEEDRFSTLSQSADTDMRVLITAWQQAVQRTPRSLPSRSRNAAARMVGSMTSRPLRFRTWISRSGSTSVRRVPGVIRSMARRASSPQTSPTRAK